MAKWASSHQAMRQAEKMDGSRQQGTSALAGQLVMLLAFSLAAMQPAIQLLGFATVSTDYIFIACWAALFWSLASGQSTFVWDKAYLLLGGYFAALLASAVASDNPLGAIPKLLTQIYLLSLPLLVVNLIRDRDDLRRSVRWWLAGSALVAVVGALSLVAFMVNPDSRLLAYTRSHFGTLPSGDYLRLRLTFLNANMACNYLTVSLMLLLAAHRLRWVGHAHFLTLLVGLTLSAFLTISPGLGGIALAGSIWIWFVIRGRNPLLARTSVIGGAAVSLLFLAAMSVTPFVASPSHFSVTIPGLGVEFGPSGRLIGWIEALRNFLADPLFGRGIGADAATIRFQDPSGNTLATTDAHNMFLSIAVQAGVLGVAAIVAILIYVVQQFLAKSSPDRESEIVRLGLATAFLAAFGYEGLGGSFEDSRHLWVLFGLLVATERIYRTTARSVDDEPQRPAPVP